MTESPDATARAGGTGFVGRHIVECALARGGGADYGALKALCEQAVHAALPGRALLLRPGIVAGPHDPTNRFSWWVARLARGGRVLAPGARERPIQLVDARDLAAFTLQMTAARAIGVYNAAGSADLTWGAMLGACASGTDAELVWVPDASLLAAGIDESQLPLWIAASEARLIGA